MIYLRILINIILPVFILVGAGYLLRRRLEIDTRSLSRSVLYVFSPALVFSALVESTLTTTDFTQIVVFELVTTLGVAGLTLAVARLAGFDRTRTNAFMLATLFINAGNYGLPVNLFAFGQPGLERAVIFFVVSAILINTGAVYFASRGQAGIRESLTNVFRVPMIYAMVLALAVRATGLDLPEVILRPVRLAGEAAIPVMLVVLGTELARSSVRRGLGAVGLAAAVRLVGAAAVAWVVAGLMGLEGVTRQVCIVQASMPTAVFTIVLSLEFNADSGFVTSAVLVSTLASIVTLTVLLGLLM